MWTIFIFQSKLALVDFGLCAFNCNAENFAIDLYVLERALAIANSRFVSLFDSQLMDEYTKIFGDSAVMKKLESVRERGRKKSVIGWVCFVLLNKKLLFEIFFRWFFLGFWSYCDNMNWIIIHSNIFLYVR